MILRKWRSVFERGWVNMQGCSLREEPQCVLEWIWDLLTIWFFQKRKGHQILAVQPSRLKGETPYQSKLNKMCLANSQLMGVDHNQWRSWWGAVSPILQERVDIRPLVAVTEELLRTVRFGKSTNQSLLNKGIGHQKTEMEENGLGDYWPIWVTILMM